MGKNKYLEQILSALRTFKDASLTRNKRENDLESWRKDELKKINKLKSLSLSEAKKQINEKKNRAKIKLNNSLKSIENKRLNQSQKAIKIYQTKEAEINNKYFREIESYTKEIENLNQKAKLLLEQNDFISNNYNEKTLILSEELIKEKKLRENEKDEKYYKDRAEIKAKFAKKEKSALDKKDRLQRKSDQLLKRAASLSIERDETIRSLHENLKRFQKQAKKELRKQENRIIIFFDEERSKITTPSVEMEDKLKNKLEILNQKKEDTRNCIKNIGYRLVNIVRPLKNVHSTSQSANRRHK